MRLSANLIVNYANINQFSFTNQWKIRLGDPNTLYFQLVDLDQNINNTNGSNGQNSYGPTSSLRYIAGCGTQNQPVSMKVTFCSIDDTKTLTVQAQPADIACDGSVWAVTLSGTQYVNSGNVFFSLTEGNSTRTFYIMNGLAVELVNNCGSC
jgi:hypothetical protein